MGLRDEVDGELKYVMDGYYASDGGLEETRNKIIALVLDKVKALTFETPKYIATSQEHLRGYNKALDNMNLAIEQLKEKDDE